MEQIPGVQPVQAVPRRRAGGSGGGPAGRCRQRGRRARLSLDDARAGALTAPSFVAIATESDTINPRPEPIATSRPAWVITRRMMAYEEAPSAMRIPISFVRWLKPQVTTPYKPETLRVSAMALRRIPIQDAIIIGYVCSASASSTERIGNASGFGSTVRSISQPATASVTPEAEMSPSAPGSARARRGRRSAGARGRAAGRSRRGARCRRTPGFRPTSQTSRREPWPCSSLAPSALAAPSTRCRSRGSGTSASTRSRCCSTSWLDPGPSRTVR